MNSNQQHDIHFSNENQNQRSPGSQRQNSHIQSSNPSSFEGYNTMNQMLGPPPGTGSISSPMPSPGYGTLGSGSSGSGPQTYAPGSRGRPNNHMNSGYGTYDTMTWNPQGQQPGTTGGQSRMGGLLNSTLQGNIPNLGADRSKTQGAPGSGGRAPIPPNWLQDPPRYGGMPASNGIILNEPTGLDMSMQRGSAGREGSADDEDLIPTAIVIKNIPFAVKKEQLVGLMTEMGLPLPYAFNYHFDNGIFRGLAFANFTSAEETQLVINALNHYELAGRKLRVEYKKMLPLVERERIEREKRIRRGQLEEQHRPLGPPGQLQNQASLSSLTSGMVRDTPSPVTSRPSEAPSFIPNLDLEFARSSALAQTVSIDFNDPMNLCLYTELVFFKRDPSRGEIMILPPTLSPAQRRVAHTIAHSLHLVHVSKGSGDDRSVHVYRTAEASASPPLGDMSNSNDPQRRALARSATTDLSDVRDAMANTIVPRSSGFLGFAPDSPGGIIPSNLRNAKSFHDLRSWSPSPNQPGSNPRFPDALMNGTTASNPNLTSALPGLLSNTGRDRDETSAIVNGLSSLGLGNGTFAPSSGSPLGSGNNRSPWDNQAPTQPPAPIGSNRTFSTVAGTSTPTA